MRPAVIISFSGLDGSGKSTQIQKLREQLELLGLNPKVLWSRGGYTSGMEALKKLLRATSGKMIPPSGKSTERDRLFGKRLIRKTWLFLAMLDLIRVYGIQLRWWSWMGRPVILDRYLVDTQIDFRMGFEQEAITEWWMWKLLKWLAPKPNAGFFLTLPVEQSHRRAKEKGDPFLLDLETMVKKSGFYQAQAKKERWIELDALQEKEMIAQVVWQRVLPYLNKR
jgi:thymidylate kinase